MMQIPEEVVTESAVLEQNHPLNLPINIPGGIYVHHLKRSVDCAIAFCALAACFPVFFVVAICVWIESKGPIFYTQDRPGKDGKVFRIFKFRTMTDERKPRITKLGKYLRDTKIDELPQLINVLKGDMSIIGPRPLWLKMTKELCQAEGFRENHPGFFHHVRPGMIGLEQINRHRFDDIEKAYIERFALNHEYECNLSWHLDLYIFLKAVVQCRFVCIVALCSAVFQLAILTPADFNYLAYIESLFGV